MTMLTRTSDQRRMHPIIADIVRETVYGGNLKDGPGVLQARRAVVQGHWLFGPVSTVDTLLGQEERQGTSWSNAYDANVIAQVVQELSDIADSVKPEGRVSVAVIAMLKPQVQVLQDALAQLSLSPFVRLLEVQTVNSFQGQEADHVIVSTVRTERPGFIGVTERANVAFTRARYGLHIVGRLSVLRSLRSDLWNGLLDTAKQLGRAGTVEQVRANLRGRSWQQILLNDSWQWTLEGWDSKGQTFVGTNSFR